MSLKGRQDSNQKKLDDHSHTSLEEEMKVYVKIITICWTTTSKNWLPTRQSRLLPSGPEPSRAPKAPDYLWNKYFVVIWLIANAFVNMQ